MQAVHNNFQTLVQPLTHKVCNVFPRGHVLSFKVFRVPSSAKVMCVMIWVCNPVDASGTLLLWLLEYLCMKKATRFTTFATGDGTSEVLAWCRVGNARLK